MNDIFYWGCGNTGGLHISVSQKRCWWDWKNYLGQDITVWFGFDASGQRRCATDGSGELVSLNAAATAMSLEHDSTTGTRAAESGSGLTVFSAVIAALVFVVVLVLFVVMRRWKMK